MTSFFFTIRRFLDNHELILTGEQLTPDFHFPARFRLDERSRKLTGLNEVEILNLEIVEDSPPVNVFDARQEAEKQAPKPVSAPPKRKPKPVPKPAPVEQIQMTLDFAAPSTEITAPAPEPFTAQELRDLQIACYGEQQVRYREEMA